MKVIKFLPFFIFLDLSLNTAKDPEKLYTALNENIEKFIHLKKLVLEGNDKYTIPTVIFKMRTLEFLSLNAFKDSSSLNELSQLQNLRFLSLDFCGLNHVPESVTHLKKLQGLDLTGNEISYLPEEFSSLHELVTLDLTNNLFTAIPEPLKQTPKLKYLDLNNAEGTDKEQLRLYHVGVNEIKTVPDLSAFRSLKELDVTYAYEATDSLQKQYAHVKVR